VQDLAELYEAGDFGEPTSADAERWPTLMAHVVGGAWAAGRMLRAVMIMAGAHPGGRVAAASHGDVVPALLAALSGAYNVSWPRHVGRGGWYTLQFADGHLAITAHNPVGIDLGLTAE
jgi:8-oxo-dGTP diphosphatase